MWLEVALLALHMARNEKDPFGARKKIRIDELGSAAAMEVLSMRAQYFHDILEVEIEQTRQMANLVEGSHDVTHSRTYRTPRAALITRIDVEAAK